jgi:hypothetical protein
MKETTGASKEKTLKTVPTTTERVTASVRAEPYALGVVHPKVVALVQAVLAHIVNSVKEVVGV